MRAGLFYEPAQNTALGGEIIYGRKALITGASANAAHLQTAAQAKF